VIANHSFFTSNGILENMCGM